MQVIFTGARLAKRPSAYKVKYCSMRLRTRGYERIQLFLVYYNHPHVAVFYIYVQHWRTFQKVRMWLHQDEAQFGPNSNITVAL